MIRGCLFLIATAALAAIASAQAAGQIVVHQSVFDSPDGRITVKSGETTREYKLST